MTKASDLKAHDIFSSLSLEGVQKVNDISEVRQFKAGQIIYQPGQATDNLYILLEGSVALRLTKDKESSTAGIFQVEKGELFGAGALLGTPRYFRQAYCVTKAKVLAINGKKFLKIIEDDKIVGFDVMTKIAQAYHDRYNVLTDKIQSIFA